MPRSQSSKKLSSGRRDPAPSRPVVFGTGLIALDVIISADRSREPMTAAGGTCANVLTALSYLGLDAYPVARLNGDAASALVETDLSRWNVALDFATLPPAAATPIIVEIIRRSGHGRPRHRFSLSCPACGAWLPAFRPVTGKAVRELLGVLDDTRPPGFAPHVFFFDRASRGALLLAETFASRGALVIFEPSDRGDPKLFSEALAAAHVLKYSRQRLPDLTTSGPESRARLLEIETCGAKGLRYRSRLLRSRAWHILDAVPAPQLVDAAGAGDWCAAGLLYRLAAGKLNGLLNLEPRYLKDGIRFGQAVAALACGYEGARGVMYGLSRPTFAREVAALLAPEVVPVEFSAWGALEATHEPGPGFGQRSNGQPLDKEGGRSSTMRSSMTALCSVCKWSGVSRSGATHRLFR